MRQRPHNTETHRKTNHIVDDVVSTLREMIPVIQPLERRAAQVGNQKKRGRDLAKPSLHNSQF
jgi:hypothetical protein